MADAATSHDSFASLSEALRDRYRIERELGHGGMATVLLARDLRHDRRVALKVLRPELSVTLGATRFLREIQLTARLQHPGILPLFDSGEVASQLWYAMPYIEGGTLRERLRRDGQLSLEEALQIAEQVLAALAVAHAQGIVHRDIKPENILLGSGRAVVADFGIAQAVSAVGTERLTETGMAIGTAAYMSPEQATGDRRLDGRSDLYAVACVLYEMLAGEPPYTGPSAQAILAKRLGAPIPRLRTVRETVPPAIEHVITKALAKSPADRYPTAEQFAGALREAGDAPVAATVSVPVRRPVRVRLLAALLLAVLGGAVAGLWTWRRTVQAAPLGANVVAVLPFRVTAPDSGYNHLREGILDLLNARLRGDTALRAVDSRTTMSLWRRAVAAEGGELATAGAVELARKLGAGRVLLGEFVVTPSRITVSGRLLGVPDGGIVAEHAEAARPGEVDELLLVDRWLGRVLALAAGEDRARLPYLSDSTEAVQAFLAGRRAHRRGEMSAAWGHYSLALDLDSTFALAAYYMVATGAHQRIEWGRDAAVQAARLKDRLNERDRAQLAAEWGFGPNYPEPYTMAQLIQANERAVELNPERAEAFTRLGWLLMFQGAAAGVDFWLPRAIVALDSALALDSLYAEALGLRLEAAIQSRNEGEIRRAAALYLARAPRADWSEDYRWLVANALGDSAGLAAAYDRLERSGKLNAPGLLYLSSMLGLPLASVEPALARRVALARSADPCLLTELIRVAAIRGRARRVRVLADSLGKLDGSRRTGSDCELRTEMIPLALAEPRAGYDTLAREYARQIAAIPIAGQGPVHVCFGELWRTMEGDTGSVRRSIAFVDSVVRGRNMDPIPYPRVGRLGVCRTVLEAAHEAAKRRNGPRPALARLEDLMARGTGLELPGNVANLMLARWFEELGDTAAAVRAARRQNLRFYPVAPAQLYAEGRLSALNGDTANAVRAYQHYLTLRDQPDPGPMADEVRQVKAHLAALTARR